MTTHDRAASPPADGDHPAATGDGAVQTGREAVQDAANRLVRASAVGDLDRQAVAARG